MFITELKERDAIQPLLQGKTVIICCEGCREVHFPDEEAAALCKELLDKGSASAALVADYLCNPDNLLLQTQRIKDAVEGAETLLVVSCGIGVQTVAAAFEGKKVFAACDTIPLPGFQGLTPLEFDCEQCGECYLNATGGICPITACSKSLVNGQCGGSKEGKCEVDKEMECGWELIYRRLEKFGRLDSLKHTAKVRNFATELLSPEA